MKAAHKGPLTICEFLLQPASLCSKFRRLAAALQLDQVDVISCENGFDKTENGFCCFWKFGSAGGL